MRLQSPKLIERILSLSAIICLCQRLINLQHTNAAIVPPPWGDPSKNPCAKLPGGWQLLYWAPLNDCFKIFQVRVMKYYIINLIPNLPNIYYYCPDGIPLPRHYGIKSHWSRQYSCKWIDCRVSMSAGHCPECHYIQVP